MLLSQRAELVAPDEVSFTGYCGYQIPMAAEQLRPAVAQCTTSSRNSDEPDQMPGAACSKTGREVGPAGKKRT